MSFGRVLFSSVSWYRTCFVIQRGSGQPLDSFEGQDSGIVGLFEGELMQKVREADEELHPGKTFSKTHPATCQNKKEKKTN